MNRSCLVIPTLCGILDKNTISKTLNTTKHKDLKLWEEENIPYTLRKKKIEFLDNGIQKAVNKNSAELFELE